MLKWWTAHPELMSSTFKEARETTPDPTKAQGGNVIISTNSNGEDVAPTISSCEYKMGQKQKDTGGGYVVSRRGDRA
jgi:hypothetical protein